MVKVKDKVRFRVRFAYAYFDPVMSHEFHKSETDQPIISKFCTRGNTPFSAYLNQKIRSYF